MARRINPDFKTKPMPGRLKGLTKERLAEFYYGQLLTQDQIGAMLGVSGSAIRWWMKQWEMPARDKNNAERKMLAIKRFTGESNPRWAYGRTSSHGYILIHRPGHPRAQTNNYVREHILVWEETHGQMLPDGWVVHHLNGIRDDNRPENLEAMPNQKHCNIIAMYQRHIVNLEKQIAALKAELEKRGSDE